MGKELDAFNRIMGTYGTTNSLKGTYDDFLIIKKALIKAREQEEVLKIVFEKCVDIDFLKSADGFEEYNKLVEISNVFSVPLTQEEFNLLKEYLKYER